MSSNDDVALDPDFARAVEALAAQDWKTAAQRFSQYVVWNPKSGPAWANLSVAYWHLSDFSSQLRSARRCFAIARTDYAYHCLGRALLNNRLMEEALVVAREGRRAHPDDFMIAEIVACAYAANGKPRRAIVAARKAASASPFFNGFMHVVVGESLVLIRRPEDAISEFDAVIEDKSKGPPHVGESPTLAALRAKAWALHDIAFKDRRPEKWQAARRAAKAVLERQPNDVRSLALSAVSSRFLAEFEVGLSDIDHAINSGEKDGYLALQRGLLLNELNRYEEAFADLEFTIEDALDSYTVREALTYRPQVLFALGRQEEALLAVKQAEEAGVRGPILENAKAAVLIRRREYDEAKVVLSDALEFTPNDPVLLSNLGWILLQQSNHSEADKLLDRAVSLVEANPWWGNNRSWLTKCLSLLDQDRRDELADLVIRMRESLAEYPAVLNDLLTDLEHVALERELAVATARIAELESTAYGRETTDSSDAWNARLAEFVELISVDGVLEEQVKQFLKADGSRFLFGPTCQRILTEHQLGAEFKADFVLAYPGEEYVLVELERPSHSLYTVAGNPTAALTHAKQQVEDWQDWVERNNDYAQKRLPGCVSPKD